jgi:hypothetical protein
MTARRLWTNRSSFGTKDIWLGDGLVVTLAREQGEGRDPKSHARVNQNEVAR